MDGQGAAEEFGVADERCPGPDRRGEPLVGVDGQRVDAGDVSVARPDPFIDDAKGAVGTVDVEPHAPVVGDRPHRIERIDEAGIDVSGRGDHGDRRRAGSDVRVHCARQGVEVRSPSLVGGNVAHVVAADPEDPGRATDDIVHLRRRVDPWRRQRTDPVP